MFLQIFVRKEPEEAGSKRARGDLQRSEVPGYSDEKQSGESFWKNEPLAVKLDGG